MRIRNLAIVSLAFAWACAPTGNDAPTVREVRFAPYLAPCPGIEAYPCLVDEANGETYPTASIRGLAFAWGVSQTIRLVRHVKENPDVDTTAQAWDADSTLMRRSETDWSFRTALSGDIRWRLDGDSLRIEGYGFAIAMPISEDRARMRMRTDAMIFELEVTPVYEAGNPRPVPGLQAKLLQVRERPSPG